MVSLPKEVGKSRALRKVCAICRRSGQRKLTRNICITCPDRPGLCGTDHFKQYHK
jgi:CO dehydrogenase/acetyl-CoA synthase beta subunit